MRTEKSIRWGIGSDRRAKSGGGSVGRAGVEMCPSRCNRQFCGVQVNECCVVSSSMQFAHHSCPLPHPPPSPTVVSDLTV